jgi:hypothetical protein
VREGGREAEREGERESERESDRESERPAYLCHPLEVEEICRFARRGT